MQLIYEIIKDNIDEIIEKKRNKIKKIEIDSIKTVKDKDNINELHREINLLKVMQFKIGEILTFIQDIEKH